MNPKNQRRHRSEATELSFVGLLFALCTGTDGGPMDDWSGGGPRPSACLRLNYI